MSYYSPSSEPDINALQLAVAMHRNEYAYRQLFLHFYKPALLFAGHILQSEDLAEEVYSDVMLKIWLMEDRLMQVASYKQYLYTALRNTAFNILKKQKKEPLVPLEEAGNDMSAAGTPEEGLLHGEFREKMQQAVASLPLQCQLVYRLIKEDGFNYKQTAQILDLSVNTVERHMTIALKKIVLALKPYLNV